MSEHVPGCFNVQDPLPFEDLFLPLVLQAGEQLRQKVCLETHRSLALAAHSHWERYLLTRLVNAGAEAAQWQFEVFKTVRMAFPESRLGMQAQQDAHYRSFVGDKPVDRLRQLLDEFPVLRKLCAVLQENWVAAGAEFLHRLQADHLEFTCHFPGNAFVLPVTDLDAGLGDPHRGGRCVIRLDFEGGGRIIYKPRSLAPEAYFSALMDACNRGDIPHQLRAPLCWDQGEYGWMENIASAPCRTQTQVHAFYWRAGALLGLIYLARGVDCHRGNLIAAGEFPVLIDLETIWHLQMPDVNAPVVPVNSVLRTGFLPRGQRRPGALYQWSGLSWIEHARRPTTVWLRINQDNMSAETQIRNSRNRSHLPVLEGKVHLAPEYAADVIAGFRWVGENLLGSESERETLARLLGVLAGCPRRRVLRPTIIYAAALRQITAPASLRDSRPIVARLETCKPGNGLGLDDSELRALAQMDIPYFAQPAAGETLPGTGGDVPAEKSYLAQIPTINQALQGLAP